MHWYFSRSFRFRFAITAVAVVAIVLFIPLMFPQAVGASGRGVIADTATAPRCLGQPPPWQFEESLGVPSLGGFSPSGIQFFGWLFFAAMAFAAVLALLMVVVGGVQYIASAGNSSGQTAAKKRLSDALLGLALTLASVLILYTINPDLTRIGAPTLDDADIEGGIRSGCLDLSFEDIRNSDPAVENCYQTTGQHEGADLRACMCSSAHYFTLTDDDSINSSCVFACLNATQLPTPGNPTPPRVCATECAGVWDKLDSHGGSVDESDVTGDHAACLQCAADYILAASDGPGGSHWDYCQCSAIDTNGNPTGLAIVPPGPGDQCELCRSEDDCTYFGP